MKIVDNRSIYVDCLVDVKVGEVFEFKGTMYLCCKDDYFVSLRDYVVYVGDELTDGEDEQVEILKTELVIEDFKKI